MHAVSALHILRLTTNLECLFCLPPPLLLGKALWLENVGRLSNLCALSLTNTQVYGKESALTFDELYPLFLQLPQLQILQLVANGSPIPTRYCRTPLYQISILCLSFAVPTCWMSG